MVDNGRHLDTTGMTWDRTPQTRFVTPGEWYDGLPAEVHRWMAVSVVAEALATAADEQGVIVNFVEVTFYTRYVARVLNRDLADDEIVEPLVYDRFSALALSDAVSTILGRGLLAVGGHGDTLNYRLTLPHRRLGNDVVTIKYGWPVPSSA